MKNKRFLAFCSIFVFGLISFTHTSCETVNSIVNMGGGVESVFTPNNEQMISALREALKKGAENAGAELSIAGAFSDNLARKIPLPPEAQPIINNISRIPGGQQQIEALILRINAAAESASKKVGPIFGEAISSMTISDAVNILKGSNTSATEYLERTTTDPLKNAFRPELDAALNEPIIAGISAQQAWVTLVTNYNTVANSPVGRLAGMQPVNADINDFILSKALSAVFNAMADVEKNVRANPVQFLSDLSTKVFNWAKK
ncbi:MAG: DUF4197 domain-containing protein [Treponema sp.]|jgi:hypothetical protein|nr:DUF4197 domain-containing protein [Treponema sp.]